MATYLPLISVIVPAYNEEGLIKKCLDSLIKQDFRKDYDRSSPSSVCNTKEELVFLTIGTKVSPAA